MCLGSGLKQVTDQSKAWTAGYCILCWLLYFSPITRQYRGTWVVSPTELFNNSVAISQGHGFPAHFCHNKTFVYLICTVDSMHWCSRKYSSGISEAEIHLPPRFSVGKGVAGPVDFRCDYIVNLQRECSKLGGYPKVGCKTKQPGQREAVL